MTRKQEIEEMAKVKASHITSDKDMQVAFADALRSGADWADRTMIDKACEWLDCYIDNYLFIDAENKAGIRWDDFINDFREAMKGGEK